MIQTKTTPETMQSTNNHTLTAFQVKLFNNLVDHFNKNEKTANNKAKKLKVNHWLKGFEIGYATANKSAAGNLKNLLTSFTTS